MAVSEVATMMLQHVFPEVADAVDAWQALCIPDAGRERVRVELRCSRGDVRTRILLQGHSRFSHVVASLAGRIRREAGVSWHEHGIDGWEVSVHRSLSVNAEPPRQRWRSR